MKDKAALKHCVELADGDHEEVRRRMGHLLESRDAWVSANASLSLLHSRWNNLAEAPMARNGHPSVAEWRKEAGL